MADSQPSRPGDVRPPLPAPDGAGSPIHRRLTLRSAVNTLLFYGAVIVLCLLLPVIVALGIVIFILFFYKREIRAFLRSPLRRMRLRAPKPPEEGAYRVEPFPPGAFDRDR